MAKTRPPYTPEFRGQMVELVTRRPLARGTGVVLGAGASNSFDFPTGVQLAQMIVNNLVPSTQERSQLLSFDFAADDERAIL
jgi:hypothetical protein